MPLLFGDPTFFSELVHRFSAPGGNSSVHVLLHSTNDEDSQDGSAVPCLGPFELADRLWICRMPDELCDIVYRVCEPRDEPQERISRQYEQLYTIALFIGPWPPGIIANWDDYGFLSKFQLLSQLAHPTSIGFRNTAALIFGPNGEFKQASPGPCRGIAEHAFTVPNTRNWLSQSECDLVKTLFHLSDPDKLPDRVMRAHWNLQYAAYEYFLEVRMMLVASGLDALVHFRTKGKRTVRTDEQFTKRAVQLASELGIPFTQIDAEAIWDHRSDVMCGRDLWEALRHAHSGFQIPQTLRNNDPIVTQYLACEQILRSTVLKCLIDRSFAAKFVSDLSVGNAFPV